MAFRLPKDARSYYAASRSDDGAVFKTHFDLYYLGAMLGLKEQQIGESKDLEQSALVDDYPKDYAEKKAIIAALLIDAEMGRQDIQPSDRESVQKLMLSLLDYQSSTLLSKEGHNLLDRYAVRGIKRIYDNIPKTIELEAFLLQYSQLLVS